MPILPIDQVHKKRFTSLRESDDWLAEGRLILTGIKSGKTVNRQGNFRPLLIVSVMLFTLITSAVFIKPESEGYNYIISIANARLLPQLSHNSLHFPNDCFPMIFYPVFSFIFTRLFTTSPQQKQHSKTPRQLILQSSDRISSF